MADPITREQVDRLLADMHEDHGMWHVIADALGEDWLSAVPMDVRLAWQRGEWGACIAALTRWRDELAAAEPVRRVARWDADLDAYALTPIHDDGALMTHAVEDAAKARAWGYEIEGGPEPEPAEDSPERLRSRREALGLSMSAAASLARINMDDVDALEGTCRRWPDCDRCGEMRPAYAAALSAEEARRARHGVKPVLSDCTVAGLPDQVVTIDPERPAPRFKAGDWVRVVSNGTVYQVGEIATPFGGNAYYFRETGGAENSWQAAALEPASPPAPEVVDVPQPVTIVKRCAGVKATWHQGGEVLSIVEDDAYETDIPLALILAMADAIRAQQGGAS